MKNNKKRRFEKMKAKKSDERRMKEKWKNTKSEKHRKVFFFKKKNEVIKMEDSQKKDTKNRE